MSTEQMPLGFPPLSYVEVQTGRTVTGPLATKVAHAADIVATARPTKGVRVDNAIPGVYKVGFTRTSVDVTLLYLAWWYRAHESLTAGDTLAVSLTIDDGIASVGPVNVLIPAAFQGTTTLISLAAIFTNPAGMTLGGEGWFDLDALAGTLNNSDDWTFTFEISRPTGTIAYVDRIEGWEVGRGTVSDADAAGALAGPVASGNPISAGSTTTSGWERIAQTLYAATRVPIEYLSLAWINDTTEDIPKTTSASFAAFTNLQETAGVPVVFRVRARPMTVAAPSGTAAGEAARFRVLYLVTGGGTAQVRLATGATGSPYDTAGLTTAGAVWAWSAWVACELPTDATGQVARLTLQGLTSAGTLYLGAVVVESAP